FSYSSVINNILCHYCSLLCKFVHLFGTIIYSHAIPAAFDFSAYTVKVLGNWFTTSMGVCKMAPSP
ncbi:MAG: hypothetical protein WA220_04340, partial [Candidatus Nitrosopolaris sp.]